MFVVKQLDSNERMDHRNRWIQGLTGCVDAIGDQHGLLLGAIIQMDWHATDDITASYKELVAALVSAHPGLAPEVLSMLIKQLLPPTDLQGCAGEEDAEAQEGLICKRYDAVHNILNEVLRIVPTAMERSLQLLVANFPHKLRNVDIQVDFLKNLLRIMVYAPNIQNQALALIVDRLVEIDVEIKLDEHFDEEDVFAMEDADEDVVEDSRVNEMADKLDEMLKLVYQFFATAAAENASLTTTFQALVQAFEVSVLPVHKSKAAQFLVFYASSLHPSFPGIFLERLLSRVADVSEPPLMRQTCVAYIGSYIARFQPLSEEELRNTFNVLIKEAQRYLNELPSDQAYPDPSKHAVFYTLCQSILYAACYKRDELMDIGSAQCTELDGILGSPLDPMRFCLDAVAREFISVAPMLGIKWADSMLLHLEKQEQSNCSNQLEMFFPFDPYLMEESREFIDAIYEVWKYGGDDQDDMSEFNDSPRGSEYSQSLSVSGSLGGMSMDYKQLARSNSAQIRPRSLSGMGHTPNARSFTNPAYGLSNSPGFEPAKIGPYKKRRKQKGATPEQKAMTDELGSLDEDRIEL
eukprot:TRINITY_DN17333_c0_g1_i3.p1 TRINITY_DN17333_c0_g1~~TRINITY_DN17333_c0_g1_i3.p1  ORF type:complete len:579 (+),score=133.83 TRINITY_DN17333_c0_g1_i3:196-1932(+)